MVRSYSFRSTSVPVGNAYSGDSFEMASYPSYLSRAKAAIGDLNDLSYQSKRHDRDFIDDINTRTLIDSTVGLPLKTYKRFSYWNPPSPILSSHSYSLSSRPPLPSFRSSRRSHFEDYSSPVVSYSRGLSTPPVGYSSFYSTPVVETYSPSSKRLSYAADSAVRQAQREVDRVERELSFVDHDPLSSRRVRSLSYAAPGRTHSFLTSPSSFSSHRYFHPVTYSRPLTSGYSHLYEDDTLPSGGLQMEEHVTHKPLYSPVHLIRCLTDTTPHTIHTSSLDEPYTWRSRPYTSTYHTPTLLTPTYFPPVRPYRSHSYHSHVTPSSVSSYVSKPLDTVATRYYSTSSNTPVVPTLHTPHFSHHLQHHSIPSSFSDFPLSNSGIKVKISTDVPLQTPHFSHYPTSANYSYSSSSSSPTSFHSFTPASVYMEKAHSVAPVSSINIPTGLERNLDSHIPISETRQKVRDVLCKTSHRHLLD